MWCGADSTRANRGEEVRGNKDIKKKKQLTMQGYCEKERKKERKAKGKESPSQRTVNMASCDDNAKQKKKQKKGRKRPRRHDGFQAGRAVIPRSH